MYLSAKCTCRQSDLSAKWRRPSDCRQSDCDPKNLGITRNEYPPELLGNYLKGQLYDAHKKWSDVNEKYINEMERLSKLVVSFRHRQINAQIIKNALEESEQLTLKNSSNELTQNRKDLIAKLHLIRDLQPFKYCNVADRDVSENDTIESIERRLIIDADQDRVLCTDEALNKKNPNQLIQL